MRRILAIDYGTQRVGAAVSDSLGITAQPLTTLEEPSTARLCAAIAALVAEYDVGTVVVGMPYTLSGGEGEAAQRTRVFVEQLRAEIPCPVATWDERLTSKQAERDLRVMAVKPSRNKPLVDTVAAMLLLRNYLDSKQKS